MLSPEGKDITVVGAYDRRLDTAMPGSSSSLERELGQLIFTEFGVLAVAQVERQVKATLESEGIRRINGTMTNIMRAGELGRIAHNPSDLLKNAIHEARSKRKDEGVSENDWQGAEQLARALIASIREEIHQKFMSTVRKMGARASAEE